MEQTLNHGMCRCCASEGMFKNFSATYQWMGADEVYADMLKECFDISLTTADDWNNGGICEVCITQLRNASNFRKQVLQTEDQFKKALQDKLYKDSIVKVEVNRDEDDLDSDNNVSDFSGTGELEFEVPVKEELEETKIKKRTAKATTSRAKKAKTEDGEPSSKRIVSIVTTDVDSISGPAVILFKERPQQRMRKAKRTGKKDNEKATDSESKEIISKVDLGMNTRKYNSRREGGSELQKHLANIKEILQWSNATPIRCRGGIGYACCYCSEQFPNPADLKSHTLLSHVGIANACFTKKRDMTGFVLKVDITNLRCKICAKDIDNLDTLMEHLTTEHKIKLYTDIKSHMLQFKFNGDQLRCFICLNEYHRFKMLLEHMSGVHNRNFICDICDAGFVNLRKLVTHSTGHNTGTFKCSYCDKVFMTLKKQKSHEICVHTRPKGNRCGYCKETFKVHAQKERHLVEVHGAQIPTFKCSACDKEFTTRRSYNVHTRRDHLMERKHACKECDMKFFCSSDLRDHMHKHTGIKNFECKICLKTYSRRSTLREHLRIHADDRKYKCEMCGMTFIQRCSWRVHVRAKHGEHV